MVKYGDIVKWSAYLYVLYFAVLFIQNLNKPFPYVHPMLQPYVNHWVKDAKKRNIDISNIYRLDSIVLQNFISPNTLGMCYSANKKIGIIAPTGKAAAFSKFHYLLITYHELGHCVLSKYHTCDRVSIMNPSFPISDVTPYFRNWDYIVDDYWDGRGMVCFSKIDSTNKKTNKLCCN